MMPSTSMLLFVLNCGFSCCNNLHMDLKCGLEMHSSVTWFVIIFVIVFVGYDYRRTQTTGCCRMQELASQICGKVIVSFMYFFTCMVMLLLLDWCTDILSSFVFQLVLACLDFDMTASNAMWDEVVRLNAEFGIDNIGSPHPHTPPSSSAIEVDPVSWACWVWSIFFVEHCYKTPED